MNELRLLADLRSEVPEPTAEAVAGAEARFRRAIRGNVRRRPVLREWRVALACCLALAVACAVAVLVKPAPTPPPSTLEIATPLPPPGSAVELLERAADAALREPALDPQPDQYLVTEEVRGLTALGPPAGIRGAVYTTWQPIDPGRTGVVSLTGETTPPPGSGGKVEQTVCTPGPAAGRPPERGGGYPALAGLPTDPAQLLTIMRESSYPRETPDATAMYAAGEWLAQYAPPAQRAAMLRAVALFPTLTLVDDVTDVAGRSGIAVAMSAPETGLWMEIVFDPATYHILGTQFVVADPALTPVDPARAEALAGVPPGTVDSGVAILSVSVSDTAPELPAEEQTCDD
jgi:hypothetical protein